MQIDVLGKIAVLILGFVCLYTSGCGCTQNWDEKKYAKYVPIPEYEDQSINGTAVFQEIGKKDGKSFQMLPFVRESTAQKNDVIIWIFDNEKNTPPTVEAVDWFEKWLKAAPNRTLVIVPAGFTAEFDYWNAVISGNEVPPNQQTEAQSHFSSADMAQRLLLHRNVDPDNPSVERFEKLYTENPDKYDRRWYELRQREKSLKVGILEGEPEWTDGINGPGLELEIFQSMVPRHPDAVILLSGYEPEGTPEVLLAKIPVGQSQVIVLENGFFILNHPLINHQRRILSGRLLSEFGEGKKHVLVLRMGGELELKESRAANELGGVLSLLGRWPLGIIIWQIIFGCVVLCFWLWPIFGRPRELPKPSYSDFSGHIDAYADMLEQTGDLAYVRTQIDRFESQNK